jgi:hypothetical protein
MKCTHNQKISLTGTAMYEFNSLVLATNINEISIILGDYKGDSCKFQVATKQTKAKTPLPLVPFSTDVGKRYPRSVYPSRWRGGNKG